MSRQDLEKQTSGYITQVMRLLHQFGIEEAVRRIVERGAQLEAANYRLKKELAARKRIESRLRKLATTDELTGLYNRRGLLTLADQQIKLANRIPSELALVYVDVDGLKRINDTYGHNEGSAALRDTADILRRTFRDSDIIARVGGDEFVVLVIQASTTGSETIGKRLQQEVSIHNGQKTRQYDLSLSAGIASLNPRCHESIEQIIAKADYEMYRNKRSKRHSTDSWKTDTGNVAIQIVA